MLHVPADDDGQAMGFEDGWRTTTATISEVFFMSLYSLSEKSVRGRSIACPACA